MPGAHRPPAPGSAPARLAAVDGLRGLAALMVVIGHVHLAAGAPDLGVLGAVLGQLGSGVDLFFVLSGFCLFYPLTAPGAAFRVRAFFVRRARRILPPYYAAIAAVLILPLVIGPAARLVGLTVVPIGHTSWQQIWTHLLLVHTLFPGTFFGIDGPFWSLGVEMQFYLVFPLAVWLVARYGPRGLALMGMVTVAYQIVVSVAVHQQLPAASLGSGNPTVDVKAIFFLGRWLEFALGMAAALLVRQRRLAAISAGGELLALAGCCSLWGGVVVFLRGGPDRWLLPVADPLFGVAFAVLLLLACTPGTRTGQLLGHRAPVWLGTISYSLYLIHLPLLLAIAPTILGWGLGGAATMAAEGLIGVPLVVACAALFFRLFERPFLTPAGGRATHEGRPHPLVGFGRKSAGLLDPVLRTDSAGQ